MCLFYIGAKETYLYQAKPVHLRWFHTWYVCTITYFLIVCTDQILVLIFLIQNSIIHLCCCLQNWIFLKNNISSFSARDKRIKLKTHNAIGIIQFHLPLTETIWPNIDNIRLETSFMGCLTMIVCFSTSTIYLLTSQRHFSFYSAIGHGFIKW